MNKVIIIGAFANGYNLLQGQTVKTRIIADEIENKYGSNQVGRIDTYGTLNHIICLFKCVLAFFRYNNIIMMPGINGLKILGPWLAMWNRIFHRRLHYIVIGGWLDNCLNDNPRLERALHEFHEIYVETQTMKIALQKRGFSNITILPNCKNLKILKKDDLNYTYTEPYRLVTFSRVTPLKGIENISQIVTVINQEKRRRVFELDIYGQVDEKDANWFNKFSNKYHITEDTSFIKYKGFAPFDKSVEILSTYFSLVFPTRYYTEGIPGTIIDAYAAGIPVISARWESFADVIEDGITGFGFEFENWKELKELLLTIVKNPEIVYQKKLACLKRAKDFLPSEVISQINFK